MTFNTITLIIFWGIILPVALYRYFFVGLPAWTQPSRASAENKLLASWVYAGEEWSRYANTHFKNLKNEQLINSRKEVRIDITSKYITFTTSAISDRLVLDGKCVRTVDCSMTGNLLNVVRGVRYPSRVGSRHDRFQKLVYQLPIPSGDENEAARVVEYFRILIQEEADNIAEIYAAQSWFQ